MASCSRKKSESDSRRDVISHLPRDVKEKILEWLSTRDAARTSLLSTQWRDVWLGHGQIVVDSDLLGCFKKYKSDKRAAAAIVNVINDILLRHGGPVKKFTLDIHRATLQPPQSDLDRWFRFLSRNGVEVLNIYIPFGFADPKYKLPSCIFSCRTIKELLLCYFVFDCPINDRCIFPCVTSLVFKHVDFKDNVNGIVSSIPNLEELVFESCEGISNFVICAPKLESLYVLGDGVAVESNSFALHLKAIKTLCLEASQLSCKNVEVATMMFPTAINLQVINLYHLDFASGEQLTSVLHLLQKSPNLCELEILASDTCSDDDDVEAASILWEDPGGCIVHQDMKMLKTVKIALFSGSTEEMLFVKMLLSKSPALERVVIQETYDIDDSMAVKILRDLVRFPRASPKAQIVCMDCGTDNLVDCPEF